MASQTHEMSAGWMRGLIGLLALAGLGCGGGSSAGQATFTALGTLDGYAGGGSDALGISADGKVVVGRAFSDQVAQGFAWSASGGMVGLGFLESFPNSGAHQANHDGSLIVGFAFDRGGQAAWYWTPAGGMQRVGNGAALTACLANDVGSNAPVVVGAASCFAQPQAYLWTAAGGLVGLGWLPDADPKLSEGKGISGDGEIIVGSSTTNGETGVHAFRWTAGDGMQALPALDQAIGSVAWGVSDNGSYIVGNSNFDGGAAVATRWTTRGAENLEPDAVAPYSIAYAVADNGQRVVGRTRIDGTDAAFLWTPQDGTRPLRDVLAAHGLADAIEGWELSVAYDITPDGRHIAGSGFPPSGVLQGFVVTLP